MRKKLLVAVLTLMTVWATGCIVIDAGKVESRGPATVRSDKIEVRQSQPAGEPAFEPDGAQAPDTAGE